MRKTNTERMEEARRKRWVEGENTVPKITLPFVQFLARGELKKKIKDQVKIHA